MHLQTVSSTPSVSGSVSLGDEIVVDPGGYRVKVVRILNASGDCVKSVFTQESVTLFLDQDIDVSRGALFHDVTDPAERRNEFNAELCWFDERPLDLHRSYLMKHACNATRIRLKSIHQLIDMETLEPTQNHSTMRMNEIGQVSLRAQNIISFDSFERNQGTGAFILIDEVTNRTIAAGTIQ